MRAEVRRRRGLALAALAIALCSACGASPSSAPTGGAEVAPPPPRPPSSDVSAGDLAPTGLPGMGPYRLLILAGPDVQELEVIGFAYAAQALGWPVTFTAPATSALKGAHGLALPLDKPLGAVDAAPYEALFVPRGAPTDAHALALMAAFAGDAAGRLLLATNGGVEALRAVPGLEKTETTSPDLGVRLSGNLLIAARPGDLPALAHALEATARDRLPFKPKP